MLAVTRAYQIALGILATLILNLALWPQHARSNLIYSLARTLDHLSRYHLSISRHTVKFEHEFNAIATMRGFTKLEQRCRAELRRAKALRKLVQLEVRLLPVPLLVYTSMIQLLEYILDDLTNLHRIRAQMSLSVRHHVFRDVLRERRDVMSSILLNLFALPRALQSRSPLPQFLPSMIEKQELLMKAVSINDSQKSLCGWDYLWYFAEMSCMRKLMRNIEQVVICTKEIVGEQAFLGVDLDEEIWEKEELSSCLESNLDEGQLEKIGKLKRNLSF